MKKYISLLIIGASLLSYCKKDEKKSLMETPPPPVPRVLYLDVKGKNKHVYLNGTELPGIDVGNLREINRQPCFKDDHIRIVCDSFNEGFIFKYPAMYSLISTDSSLVFKDSTLYQYFGHIDREIILH